MEDSLDHDLAVKPESAPTAGTQGGNSVNGNNNVFTDVLANFVGGRPSGRHTRNSSELSGSSAQGASSVGHVSFVYCSPSCRHAF